ncbi:hypothetical protein ACFV2Q_27355 [Streptomyces sp. NPDC059650]|uniref:hypothetical protein n=1 Tax=Streptomyces sp. NPDC059650 TaxID=3346896 RepID=UPI0036CDFF9A
MTALMSDKVAAIERFRNARGPIETWTSADFDAFQNLTEVALASRPVGGFIRTARRRTVTLAVVGYAFALYLVTGLVHALRGTPWTRLQQHLEAIAQGPVARVDTELRRVGDLMFWLRVEHVGHLAADAVDRLTVWLGRA